MAPPILGVSVGDPEAGVAHRQLGDDVLAVTNAMRHDRAERGLVERDRLGGVLDPQFGLDVAYGESSEAAVSCQIPSTLPAGSANSATRRVPSGYGGLTICPPEATTAVRVCSTSAT